MSLRFLNWSAPTSEVAQPFSIPVAVISLPESADRRATLLENGFPREMVENFWPALDSRGFSHDELSSFVSLEAYDQLVGGLPRRGRTGNAISQRNAMAAMCESGAHAMLIFEDDAFAVAPEVFDLMADLLAPLYEHAVTGGAFICHLGVKRSQRRCGTNMILSRGALDFFSRWRLRDAGRSFNIWRSHAYLISRTAALRTIKGETPMRTGADDFGARYELGYFERFFFIEPGLFCQSELTESLIERASSAAGADSVREMAKLTVSDVLRRLNANRFDF